MFLPLIRILPSKSSEMLRDPLSFFKIIFAFVFFEKIYVIDHTLTDFIKLFSFSVVWDTLLLFFFIGNHDVICL